MLNGCSGRNTSMSTSNSRYSRPLRADIKLGFFLQQTFTMEQKYVGAVPNWLTDYREVAPRDNILRCCDNSTSKGPGASRSSSQECDELVIVISALLYRVSARRRSHLRSILLAFPVALVLLLGTPPPPLPLAPNDFICCPNSRSNDAGCKK